MLLVHLERPTPRARYIVRHVFERMLGWPLTFSASLEEFRAAGGPKLIHGTLTEHDAVHVPRSAFWDESRLPDELPHQGEQEHFRLFPVANSSDVFAACFYLLALCEERSKPDRDAHDRFPSEAHVLVRNGVHERPVVDQWVLRLAAGIRARFPQLPLPQRRFNHVLTVDVDNGAKYAARSWSRAVGASAKDLLGGQVRSLGQRWMVRSGAATDPYASFVEPLADVKDRVERTIAFVLTRSEGRFDHAARLEHPVLRTLLAELASVSEIGLHPSYESSRTEAHFQRERDRLSAVVRRSLNVSRQHFLRWQLPHTLRTLQTLGFTEEHSLGFSDRVGFRVGTCTPFPWYDMEREEETALMLWPFAAMDSALLDRQGSTVPQMLGSMKRMSDAVRAVQGTFVSVWHDRYLSGHGAFSAVPAAMRELVQHTQP
jgi:hypothetical protein